MGRRHRASNPPYPSLFLSLILSVPCPAMLCFGTLVRTSFVVIGILHRTYSPLYPSLFPFFSCITPQTEKPPSNKRQKKKNKKKKSPTPPLLTTTLPLFPLHPSTQPLPLLNLPPKPFLRLQIPPIAFRALPRFSENGRGFEFRSAVRVGC